MNSVFKSDVKQANKLILDVEKLVKLESAILKRLFELRLNTEALIGLRMMIESIRRIAEYSADIAEIVINLAVKS